MSSYRMVWVSVTAFVVGAASIYDVVSGGLARMASLGLGFGLFGAFAAFTLAEENPGRRAWVRRSALWCGLATVSADALITTWASAGAGMGVVLLLASPPMVSYAWVRFESWSSRRTSGPPDALSTRDLRRRWDVTTAEVLRPTTTVSRRLALVEERRTLLDELQLRDPLHFEAWLVTAVPDRRRARPWSRGR